MVQVPYRWRVSWLATLLAGLVAVSQAQAKGHPRASHSGGGHHPAMHAAPKPHPAPKPHAAPHHTNAAPKTPAVAHHTTATPHTTTPRTGGRTSAANVAGVNRSGGSYHRSYRGRGRMPYRRSYYGYHRRSGLNRYNGALVSRLRSAHAMLARSDRDYKGHRIRAMRHVRSAIRQLSYSSRGRYGYGSRSTVNRTALRNNRGAGARKGRLSQAQSDGLMRRALNTLQLVNNHMMNQGGTSRHSRAAGYVQRAGREINVALNIR